MKKVPEVYRRAVNGRRRKRNTSSTTLSANLSLKITNMLYKQVTTSTQDRLDLLENLCDDFRAEAG